MAVLRRQRPRFQALRKRVEFNLHHLRLDVLLHDGIERIHAVIEVADAQRTDFSLAIGFLQPLPSADNRVKVARRMVQVDEVDVVHTKTFQHLVVACSTSP